MTKDRMIVDTLMVLILPVLMAYSLVGEFAHEVLGITMFALFITHHIINRKWWASLARGKYTPVRVLNTAVNLLLAVFMIAQPVSGILMSKYVLKSITIAGAASEMRTIHMTLAYWGFMLMSFHLGLHVRPMAAKIKMKTGEQTAKLLNALFLILAAYGVYAFIKRGIGGYMLMRTQFAFFDFSEPRIIFFLDYIAVMIFAAQLAFRIQRLLTRNKTGSKA